MTDQRSNEDAVWMHANKMYAACIKLILVTSFAMAHAAVASSR
jgi:hypothetical protein